MGRESVGEFEHLILLAILRLKDEAYGGSILEELSAHTDRTVLRPAVYNALRRLEAKGLISSRLGDPTPERGGRAKRFLMLEPAGLAALRDSRATLLSMWDGVDDVLDGAS